MVEIRERETNELMKKTHKRVENTESKKQKTLSFSDGIEHSEEEMEIFFESRRTVSELVAPLGVNTLPLEYMVVEDNGALIYTMCMYIHKLRRRKSTFADTYAQLFNTPGVTSNVFISPLGNEKSSKQLDKRIEMLGSEQYAAMDNGDRNRYRKITGKLADAERYASAVDNGDDQLFKVAFLFTVTGETLDALRMNVNDLHITKKYPSAPKEVIDTYRGGVDNFVTQRYRFDENSKENTWSIYSSHEGAGDKNHDFTFEK